MMQNFCILLSTLFVSTYLKSTFCARIEENQSNLDSRTRPCSESERSQRMSNEEEEDDSRFGPCHQGDKHCVNSFNSNEETPKIPALTDAELITYLLNRYFRGTVPQNEIQLEQRNVHHKKRALTMLSRWKPFQVPTAIGENGRHTIRSSLIARSDPFNKLQIMGRPLRWG